MGEIAGKERNVRLIAWLVALIAVMAAGFALKATRIVTMPLAFAFFIVVLVHPFHRKLCGVLSRRFQKFGLVLTMLLILLVLTLFGAGIWFSVTAVADRFPGYADKIIRFWQDLTEQGGRYSINLPRDIPPPGEGKSALGGMYGAVVTSLSSLVEVLVLVFFLVLLLLFELGEWKAKVEKAFPGRGAGQVIETARTIAKKVRVYFLVHTVISALSAAGAAAWLLIMGVDFALVWGLLTFLLNYVPYIGSVIAVFPPSLVALLQLGPGPALVVLSGLAVIDQVMGNYVDPRIQGQKLVISPTVILISLVFWSWVWGVAGALLAVPLTITIVITCDHIPALKPLAQLLSRGPGSRAGGREGGET
ncbi:MAG: AI-2E family transporter [Endomicrobiales bacterium]